MNIINLALASGVGSRLYPLSTEERPKQFINLVGDNMMIEDTLNRFKPFVHDSYIVTLSKYKEYVKGLGFKVVYEDDRKESSGSVLNAISAIAMDYEPKDTIIIQTPTDHYIKADEHFKKSIDEAVAVAKQNKVAVIGKKPNYPNTGLGYIKDDKMIEEKPNERVARALINKGYYWNTAIYAYPLKRMLQYYKLFYDYNFKPFEKTILSNIRNEIKVIPSKMQWEDIGTFDKLNEIKDSKNNIENDSKTKIKNESNILGRAIEKEQYYERVRKWQKRN